MIVLSHPEWWVDHPDELVDALTIAASSPEADEPDLAGAGEVEIADPAWWLDHVDELIDGLNQAAAERGRDAESGQEPTADRGATEARGWGDVDAMSARRQERSAQARDEAGRRPASRPRARAHLG